VVRTSDRMFPYRCLQCDTRLTEGALPDVVIVQPEEVEEIETAQNTDDAVEATWTTAPVDYDGFGTMTIDGNVGMHCDKPLRKVTTPRRHVQWQRDRYGSGLHAALDEAGWGELRVSPGFCRENGNENLMDRPDYQAFIAETAAELAALPTAIGSMAPKVPAPTSTAAAELIAMIPDEDQASLAPRLTVLPALTSTDPRVQYLYDLIPQGEAAILEELRRGKVRVHLPKAPRAPRPTTGSGVRGFQVDDATIALVRTRVAGGGISQTALAKELGLGKMTVNGIVRKVGAYANR
jgi:hypothetical protein